MPASFASLDSESEMRRKWNPHRFSRCGKRSSGDGNAVSDAWGSADVGICATGRLTLIQNAQGIPSDAQKILS